MDNSILESLSKPFDIKERRGLGNKTFKYVATEDIVDRMNTVFNGDWSTEVRSSSVVEDQVLMCVRVTVSIADGRFIFHDGYASHAIARYSSGVNNGKVIDIGNAYKSAMSKAIKTAVVKWGVGLYLEQSDDTASLDGNLSIPTIATPVPVNNTPIVDAPIESKPFQSSASPIINEIPISTTPVHSYPGHPAVATTAAPQEFNGPPAFTQIDDGSQSGPPSGPPVVNNAAFQPPVFTVDNVESPTSNDGFGISSNDTNETLLTPVQRVAIATTMSLNDITFEDLLVKSLQRTDNLPASLEVVSYLDAVSMIQYGNNLRKI